MKVMTTAITGREQKPSQGTPVAALVDFYRAFNGRDFERMAANWLQTEAASMSNPLGGVKRGWTEIRTVYEKIFSGPASVYVEFYDYTVHETGDMFIAVGRERGMLMMQDQEMALAIRTSRTYCKQDGAWKQLHHHGSMDDAQMLQRYQGILLGGRK